MSDAVTPVDRKAIYSLVTCFENYHAAVVAYGHARRLLAEAQAAGDGHRLRLAQWDFDAAGEAVSATRLDMAGVAIALWRAAAEVSTGALSAALAELPVIANLAIQIAELQDALANGGGK